MEEEIEVSLHLNMADISPSAPKQTQTILSFGSVFMSEGTSFEIDLISGL